MMRRIALLTILSVAFLFSFAAVAFAALPTAGTAGPAGTPAIGGTNGTGYTSPVTPAVKYDTPTHPVIHSNYSANTDACASCHATHTAVGANLLQWADTSTACMACHDGTVTTTYNVKAGQIANTATKTSGGLFGIGTETGLSHHNVTGGLTTSAAMGGSENSATVDVNGKWSTPFSCAACHSPHGQGGNSRILSADPNGWALQNKVVGETLAVTTAGTTYTAAKANWIAGYPYSDNTKIYVNASPVTTGFTINYRTGVVTFSPAIATSAVVKADYVPGIHVVMNVTNKLLVNEAVAYTGGVNQFCGACHTDYNTSTVAGQTGSGHTLTGQYRSAYRHQVGMTWDDAVRGTNVIAGSTLKFESVSGTQGKVMCLTCHYAHGTDDAFAGGTTSDTGRSTALKRQVNMSVCETCHQKGAASNY
ncbi:MAG: cytochrome c3 family protein [Desulfitobacteriaceae bacterium]|nr:cytochrome c3 family protein [Desulfitobacteriaceae bacterium]MDI6877821.1 cytochrome c3 family protein [Desulfitobacteriaceae bacterium]MDI6912778.1 cytochrome c3 family protein [Desulfitobacteriaceae bacterium]